jgi:hypothetical protein
MGNFVELKTVYDRLLRTTERALLERHLERPGKAMHSWRQGLEVAECDPMMCRHMQRTMRFLRGDAFDWRNCVDFRRPRASRFS